MKYFYSFYAESFRIALTSILAHKLRAFLTLIGIIIGVSSVVLVGAAISGLNTYVLDKVGKMLGTNHFMIARMVSAGEMSEEELERRNRRNPKLQFTDVEWLKEQCKSCSAVGAEVGRGTKFEQNGETFYGGVIFGVTAPCSAIWWTSTSISRSRPSHASSAARRTCRFTARARRRGSFN